MYDEKQSSSLLCSSVVLLIPSWKGGIFFSFGSSDHVIGFLNFHPALYNVQGLNSGFLWHHVTSTTGSKGCSFEGKGDMTEKVLGRKNSPPCLDNFGAIPGTPHPQGPGITALFSSKISLSQDNWVVPYEGPRKLRSYAFQISCQTPHGVQSNISILIHLPVLYLPVMYTMKYPI